MCPHDFWKLPYAPSSIYHIPHTLYHILSTILRAPDVWKLPYTMHHRPYMEDVYVYIYIYGIRPQDLPDSMLLETLLTTFTPIVHDFSDRADLWRGNLP